MSAGKLNVAKRTLGMENNVWVEFSQLAVEHNPCNLGQGYPDFAAPDYLVKALCDATSSKDDILLNQYTRSFGHPRLVRAISKLYSRLLGRDMDPMTEILVTLGGQPSIYCCVMAYIEDGDEVIVIEPFFDSYAPMVEMAGGKCVYIPLRPKDPNVKATSSGDFVLDPVELESKFNSKTKAIIVNNPNNPLGKVFSRSELEMIGQLAKKYDSLIVMDEVYEWITYEGTEHVRMASLPGMWDRTLTLCSAGKTFNITGWKIGWVYGPKTLLRGLQVIHQNAIYCCPTPLQEAIAIGFETELERYDQPDCFLKTLPAGLKPKRDKMARFLREVGMTPIVPEGGYFMLADYTNLAKKVSYDDGSDVPKDYKFARWLIKEKKLAAIPPSIFYSGNHKPLGENYLRFCFIKQEETLDQAEQILKEMKKSLGL